MKEQNSDVKSADGGKFIVLGFEIRGKSISKPNAKNYPFYTYWSVDIDPSGSSIEISDGSKWVVM